MNPVGPDADVAPVLHGVWWGRMLSVPVALLSGAVLALALWLEPVAIGHGTHMQLGLGQCSFLDYVGQPCPMCGATTSFALMAELRPIAAVVNQPFASVLFVLTVGVFGLSVSEVVVPRRRWQRLLAAIEPWETRLALGFLAMMGLSWLWKIAMMSRWFGWAEA